MRRFTLLATCGLLACGGSSAQQQDAASNDAAPGDGAVAVADAIGAAETTTDTDFARDDDPDLLNPERGMYYWSVQQDDPHSLVAEWLYLGAVCDQDLTWLGHGNPGTTGVLNDYVDELLIHRAAGRKVIFRPRYDVPADDSLNGCGVFHADTWDRQLGHVDAIAAMLGEYSEVIAFVEAGYLGRWGEWNWSGYDATAAPFLADPDTRRNLMSYVLGAYAAAGFDRSVELRRPVFARELTDAEPSAKVGLYNDCFMTSDSDSGTYSNFESNNPANFASSEEAKAWAVTATAEFPFGGETCPYASARWKVCANMVGPSSEPASLHMAYLHGGWAPDARATWEAGGCYDEIKRSLGYRFGVERVTYPPAVSPAQSIELEVAIDNAGWSRMNPPRTAFLVLRGTSTAYVVGADLNGYERLDATEMSGSAVRDWLPGETSVLSATFAPPPPGTYQVTLFIPDPDAPAVVDYAVGIASSRAGEPVFDAVSGENDLGVTIAVSP